jgi:hypothetical protein
MPFKKTQPAVIELFPGRPKALSWFEDTHSVLEVGEWLEDRGELPPLPAEWRTLLEKPWHFEQDHHRMVRSRLDGEDTARTVRILPHDACACCATGEMTHHLDLDGRDPWRGRLDAYCEECSTCRCDAYPGACRNPGPEAA